MVSRRTGKIKGIERFLGAVDTLQESLIEVTSGQAKYEHQHRAIVWRMPRLPKEGQGTILPLVTIFTSPSKSYNSRHYPVSVLLRVGNWHKWFLHLWNQLIGLPAAFLD